MNRVRIIYNENGAIYTGNRAIKRIEYRAAMAGMNLPVVNPFTNPFKPMSRWQYAVTSLNTLTTAGFVYGKLTVYREPRQVRLKNSRFRQAVRILNGLDGLPPTRPAGMPPQRGRGARPPAIAGHNKIKPQRSRTVRMLEQELMARAEAF